MARRQPSDPWAVWDKRVRDLIIFLIGIGALVNELFLRDEIRVTALLAACSLLGLPLTLRADELRRDKK